MSYPEDCLKFARFVEIAEALENALAAALPGYKIDKESSEVEELSFMSFYLIVDSELSIYESEISIIYQIEYGIDSKELEESLIFESERGMIDSGDINWSHGDTLKEKIIETFRREPFDMWRAVSNHVVLSKAIARLRSVAPIEVNADLGEAKFIEALYAHYNWSPDGKGAAEAKRDFEEKL